MNTLLIILTAWALVFIPIFLMGLLSPMKSFYDFLGVFIASSVVSFIISVVLLCVAFLLETLVNLWGVA